MSEEIQFACWELNTRSYSIDEDVPGATRRTMTVRKSETFVQGGNRYYPCVEGMGIVVRLLVGPTDEPDTPGVCPNCGERSIMPICDICGTAMV